MEVRGSCRRFSFLLTPDSGAVGIEMAAELKLIYPDLKVTLIHSREKLLSSEPLPDEFKDRALAVLKEGGVEVIMGRRVTETTAVDADHFKLTLSDGTQIVAGQVVNAISRSVPTSSFLPSAILDSTGHVKVQPWYVHTYDASVLSGRSKLINVAV